MSRRLSKPKTQRSPNFNIKIAAKKQAPLQIITQNKQTQRPQSIKRKSSKKIKVSDIFSERTFKKPLTLVPIQIKIYHINIEPYLEEILITQVLAERKQMSILSSRQISNKIAQTHIDDIIKICHSLQLQQSTLYLALTYLTEALTFRHGSSKNIWEICLACIWISNKYEEVEPVSMNQLLTAAQFGDCAPILESQGEILMLLEYHLVRVSAATFLQYICKPKSKLFSFSHYLVQLYMTKYFQKMQRPSVLAICAFKYAYNFIGEVTMQPKLKKLQRMIGITVEEEGECLGRINRMLQNNVVSGNSAIYRKFGQIVKFFVPKGNNTKR